MFLDESGSDSEDGGSGDSTSSYSSLSDFVSELASSDLSPSGNASIVAHRKKSHRPAVEEFDFERDQSHDDFRGSERNVTSICSSLDLSTVYRPPSSLQLPGDLPRQRKESISGSGSGSDSESSVSSGDAGESRRESVDTEKRKSSGGGESITSSIEQAAASGLEQRSNLAKPVRQGSFGTGSILGQIATQAKELVKETKRQSSQEGLLSHVDKVNTHVTLCKDIYKKIIKGRRWDVMGWMRQGKLN